MPNNTTTSSSKFISLVDRFIHLLKIAAIGGVFAFKFLEWLVAAENKLPRNASYIPPPPVPLRPSSKGISLPTDKSLCPLCHQVRRNPAVCVSTRQLFYKLPQLVQGFFWIRFLLSVHIHFCRKGVPVSSNKNAIHYSRYSTFIS